MIAKGDDIISNCAPTESLQIAEKIRKLKERTTDTKNRAAKRKVGVFLIVTMFEYKKCDWPDYFYSYIFFMEKIHSHIRPNLKIGISSNHVRNSMSFILVPLHST